MLELVKKLVAKATEGSRWPKKDLLLKLQKDLGDVVQAVRTDGDLEGEVGDVMFTLLAFTEEAGVDIAVGLNRAIRKHLNTVGTERAQAPK